MKEKLKVQKTVFLTFPTYLKEVKNLFYEKNLNNENITRKKYNKNTTEQD